MEQPNAEMLLYRGVDIEKLTREELVQAIRVLYRELLEERKVREQTRSLFC